MSLTAPLVLSETIVTTAAVSNTAASTPASAITTFHVFCQNPSIM